MPPEFKTGDRVRVIITNRYDLWCPYKKGDIGEVVGDSEGYGGSEFVCKVNWPKYIAKYNTFWYTPTNHIAHVSVIHLEDHLKEKDVL